MFSGLWIPLITPFQNTAIDHAALSGLVRRYAVTGIQGFVVCGTTGEAAALDEGEQLTVLANVHETLKSIGSNCGIVMGVSGYNQAQTCAWVKQLAQLATGGTPLAGLLVSAPHYIRPAQDGIHNWFSAIAEAAQLPVIVYDIPYRTGVQIELATLRRLAQHPFIRGIKDCGGDWAKTQALIADGQLAVLAGEDMNIFATLAAGGAGAIAASLHLQTERFVQVANLIQQGQLTQARPLWQSMQPMIEAMFTEPNPAPVKAMLAQQGLITNELRAPMTVASPTLSENLSRYAMYAMKP